jgi:pimeloyl-ACP methyl ester carboxylesterase
MIRSLPIFEGAFVQPSDSLFLDIRGIRLHCRSWGDPSRPKLFLLHGWMDVSASFQFLVDAFRHPWHVLAPDWRGYGLSDWGGSDSYWFPDYLADLDRLLSYFQPDAPVCLVGHSMGGNVATMYAGIRPERVARLVNMEGFGLRDASAEEAPRRYARWLAEIEKGARFRDYDTFENLAVRLRSNNPRLTPERALFLAQHWGVRTADGCIALRGDPAHKLVNPVLYRLEEAKACWSNVAAPVLWVEGEDSQNGSLLKVSAEDRETRKACFGKLIDRVIPEAGHMMHHDQPELVAALIEDFLLAPEEEAG